jgi:hypothetical protein
MPSDVSTVSNMTSRDETAGEEAHCALCGEANLCAMAAGLTDEECWCSQIPFAADAFAQLSPSERGRRCICPRCAVKS